MDVNYLVVEEASQWNARISVRKIQICQVANLLQFVVVGVLMKALQILLLVGVLLELVTRLYIVRHVLIVRVLQLQIVLVLLKIVQNVVGHPAVIGVQVLHLRGVR